MLLHCQLCTQTKILLCIIIPSSLVAIERENKPSFICSEICKTMDSEMRTSRYRHTDMCSVCAHRKEKNFKDLWADVITCLLCRVFDYRMYHPPLTQDKMKGTQKMS